jgi:hypothetical protein
MTNIYYPIYSIIKMMAGVRLTTILCGLKLDLRNSVIHNTFLINMPIWTTINY